MNFIDVYSRYQSKLLSCKQAAEILGISVSSFYRKRQRYEKEGEQGLVDRRIGKISARRVPVDERMKIISLFETQYHDVSIKHFHEKLREQGINYSYTFVKNILHEKGVIKKAKKETT